MDILFDAAKLPEGHGIPWTPVMMVLIRRVLEADYIKIVKAAGGVFLGGLQQSPDYLILTKKGREFLQEFGDHEF